MILRSYSRTDPSFLQLARYIADEHKITGPPLAHNLDLDDAGRADLSAVAACFRENARHIPVREGFRKNGVILYHEILSLSEKDRQSVPTEAFPHILRELAAEYLALRASGALAWGAVHLETGNPHIHLMISANLRGRPQKLRLSTFQFARVKRTVDALQRARFPELVHSRVDHGPSPERDRRRREQRAPAPAHAEHQRVKRLARQNKPIGPTRKEILHRQAAAALIGTRSFAEFQSRLHAHDIETYERNGRPAGLIARGKKYRFDTLGLVPALEQAERGWAQYRENRRLLEVTYAEKHRRLFRREYGYHLDIAAVLEQADAPERTRDPERDPENHPEESRKTERGRNEKGRSKGGNNGAAPTEHAPANEEKGRGVLEGFRVRAAAAFKALFVRKRQMRRARNGRDGPARERRSPDS